MQNERSKKIRYLNLNKKEKSVTQNLRLLFLKYCTHRFSYVIARNIVIRYQCVSLHETEQIQRYDILA